MIMMTTATMMTLNFKEGWRGYYSLEMQNEVNRMDFRM
jgi:hypothetical protein